MKKVFFILTLALMCVMQADAQNAKVDDKELVGTWIMESTQWKGEKKIVCGKEMGYTQFKYYGPDGEYACAIITMDKNGKCAVSPHEYGTYTFKDGWYSEMGREKSKDSMIMIDKNTFKGVWEKKRFDIWKKVKMPEKLRKYLIDCCKTQNPPADVQQMMKQNIFK